MAAPIAAMLSRLAQAATAARAGSTAAAAGRTAAAGAGRAAGGTAAAGRTATWAAGKPPLRDEVRQAERIVRLREWAQNVPEAPRRGGQPAEAPAAEEVGRKFRSLAIQATGLVGAFAFLAKKVSDAGRQYATANAERYAEYSGTIANAYARLQLQQHQLNLQTAAATAGTAKMAADSARGANEAVQPFREVWTDVKNTAATAVNKITEWTAKGFVYGTPPGWAMQAYQATKERPDLAEPPWVALTKELVRRDPWAPHVPRPGRREE